jgi:hypothetical protein
MQFNVNEWRMFYDKVKILGQILKDSKPTVDINERIHAPRYTISEEATISLEKEIDKLIKQSSIYLDACGIKHSDPLWKYDKKNPETWASDEKFKFKHLTRLIGKKCILCGVRSKQFIHIDI